MTILAVVYHSDSGHTKLMAEAVLEGAASISGVETQIHRIDRKQVVEGRYENEALLSALDLADAIVFGCPTYMGDVSGPMKAFLDATLGRWYQGAWNDKVGAAFTISSTPSGDKLSALMSLMVCAMQQGMVWVGLDQKPINAEGLNRLGFYVGAGGQAEYGGEDVAIDARDRQTGVLLGARVATITSRLR